MSKDFRQLNILIIKYKIMQFFITYFNKVIEFLLMLAGLFILLVLMVIIFDVPPHIIKAVFGIFASVSTVWFIINLYKIKKSGPLRLSKINSDMEENYSVVEDRLVNTISLWKDRGKYTSEIAGTVINRLLHETLFIFKTLPRGVLNAADFKKNILYFTTVFLAISVMIMFSPDSFMGKVNEVGRAVFQKQDWYIRVEPGSKEILSGESMAVRVYTNSITVPEIEVERLDSNYREKAIRIEKDVYEYHINEIREDIRYRALSNNKRLKSEWYDIVIKSPPVAGDILLTYRYPAYMGYRNKISSATQIDDFRGTSVTVEAMSSASLKTALLRTDKDEMQMKIISKERVSGSFVLEDQTFYQIIIEDESGMSNVDSPRYPVNVMTDLAPDVDLQYPKGSLKVSPEAKVELTGATMDNIGLKKIYIEYYIDMGGSLKKVPVKTITEDNIKHEKFSYIWDLSKTDVLPGSIVTYKIAAEDNNTLYGPGVGHSESMQLEITGFRDKHDEILKKTEEVEEKILSLLAESYELSSFLEKSDFANASEKLDTLKKDNKELSDYIEKLADEMEGDPYTEKPTIDEFKAMRDVLNYLSEKNMPDLKKSISKKEGSALGKSKKISSELERMMRLSKDALEREKMSDVLSSASDSLEKARDLADMLNQEDITPQDIMKKIEKLNDLIEQMRKAVKEFPQDLPEEFINQESMKELDFSDPQKGLADLMEALRSGDMEAAREILNSMIDSLQAVMNTLQEAAGEAHSERREKLMKRSAELQKKMENIIDEQRRLIEETQDEKDFLNAVRADYEKERMAELKEKYEVLRSSARIRIYEVEREFEKGYLYKTAELLEERKNRMKQEWKKKLIDEYLGELRYRKPDRELLTEARKSELNSISQEQEELRKQLDNLKEGISTLGHLTAMLDMKLMENLDLAGVYMGDAARSLSEQSPSRALPSERQALSHLLQSNNEMMDFAQKLQSIPQSLSSGSRMNYQPYQTKKSGGRSGYSEGYVEIPDADQAQDGKEFRKRILKALKEKYPSVYKELIEKYFRSLGE
ncbi:DUF4175 family protein [Elusimicrobiota bacterium]